MIRLIKLALTINFEKLGIFAGRQGGKVNRNYEKYFNSRREEKRGSKAPTGGGSARLGSTLLRPPSSPSCNDFLSHILPPPTRDCNQAR